MLQTAQATNDVALAYYAGTRRVANPYTYLRGIANYLKRQAWFKGYDDALHEVSIEKDYE